MTREQFSEIRTGRKLWTIAPSAESVCYGYGDAVSPWFGVVVEESPSGRVRIAQFDEATGEPDMDGNAVTQYLSERDERGWATVFATEEEAWGENDGLD